MQEDSQPSLKARSSPPEAGAAPSVVRLLGPVDLLLGDRPVRLGSGRARTMLAALAVRAGQVTQAETLIDVLWGDRPPKSAAHAIHVHASTLRRFLPQDLPLAALAGGYVLQLGAGRLDSERFEQLAAQGRAELASGHPEDAAVMFGNALALWRGPALADVPWERCAEADVRRWDELRLATQEDMVDAQLAGGSHASVIATSKAWFARSRSGSAAGVS